MALGAILGCNSDDRERWALATTGTTEADPTEVPAFTTAEPVDTTEASEPPVPMRTCRGAIYCATQCLLDIPADTPPEHDWQSCFFDGCLEELTAEEWLKVFDLIECVVGVCDARPECVDGTDMCNACYLAMMAQPPAHEGCDAPAAACD